MKIQILEINTHLCFKIIKEDTMNVIDMGQFGQKRPSVLSGLSDAMQEGAKTGTQQGEAMARVAEMAQQKAYQQQELKLRQAEISRQIDKDSFEKEMKQAEHGKVVAEDLALQLHSMSPTMRATTLGSPSIKALTDNLKKSNQEFFNDKGAFVPPQADKILEQRIKTGLEQMRLSLLQRTNTLDYPKNPNGTITDEGLEQYKRDKTALNNWRYDPNTADGQAIPGVSDSSNYDAAQAFNERVAKVVSAHGANPTPGVQPGSPQHNQIIHDDILKALGRAGKAFMTPNQVSQGLSQPAQPASTSAVPMVQQAGVPQQGGGNTPSAQDIANAANSV